MYQILQIYVLIEKSMCNKSDNSVINNSTGPVSDWVTEKTGSAEHQLNTHARLCFRQNSDTWTSNWVVGHSPCWGGVPTITLHRRHSPAARPIVFPTNNCKKAAGCRVNFSRWQNCLWRCHARCLRGLQQHGHWAIVLGFFTPAHISIIRLSWPFSCDNIYNDVDWY